MSTTTDISDIDATPVDNTKTTRRAAKAAAAEDGRRIVTIHPGSESDGMAPVKVGVNGDTYLIPRNVPSPLPDAVIEVLKNAVFTEYREVNGEYQPFERQRFSFSIA